MRRYLVAAGSFTLLLASATGVAGAQEDQEAGPPVVVADGLDNPRQLNWSGDTLLVAEAGQGGDDCAPAPAEPPTEEPPPAETPEGEPPTDADGDTLCDGPTAGISAIADSAGAEGSEAERIVDGLYSVESAEGSIGSDGVAATGFPGVLLIAQGEGTPDALAEPGTETDDPAAETEEHLLLSVEGEVFPWVDLGEAETEQDPDENGVADSNPNAVIIVDPTPDGDPGVDEYALVADAGANAVWKVTPDFSDLDENELPAATVTVFAAFPVVEGETQFVPSALDQDEDGNIYVGGVGGVVPGGASVVRLDADGEETDRWDGFTGLNGLAVDEDGRYVYVAQVFGNDGPPAGTGSVVRFDTEDDTWAAIDVPYPSGLALGQDDDSDDGNGPGSDDSEDSVYVSAYSIFPADADDPATEEVEGGQVWRIEFRDDAEESPLPVTTPPDPAATEAAADAEDAVTDDAATEDAVTDDAATDGPVTEEPVTDPTVPDTTVTDPTVTDPTVTDPTVTDPALPELIVPEPVVLLPADDGTADQGTGDAAP